MKERFSKIFELWNQRNIGFYKECFKKLETENKTSFNYIAGMFPVMWMVFRKMYGCAILICLVLAGVNAVQAALIHPTETMSGVVTIALLIIEFVIFGFIGSKLYLNHVRSKVEKRYAEIEDYNSIDPIWCVLYAGLSVLIGPFITISLPIKGVIPFWGASLVSGIISALIILIPWIIDCKKCCSQGTVEPLQVTEGSIGKYLEKANSQKMFAAAWVLVACFLVASVTNNIMTKMVGNQIKDQLNHIADDLDNMPSDTKEITEDLDKTPTDTKESDSASNNVAEQLNKVSEEIEETSTDSEKDSGESDVSGAVTEVQNSNIDDQIANLADEIDKTLNDSKNSEITEESIESEESDETQNVDENLNESIQNDQDLDQPFDENDDQD